MALMHLRVRTGSRSTGAIAAASAAYICRLGAYGRANLDPVVFVESANMPSWGAGKLKQLAYWAQADVFERKNGRLFTSAEFSLPRELPAAARRELGREVCSRLARTPDGEPLPYLMAIHLGKGNNPHCHLMISERIQDNVNRPPELWFGRAAVKGRKPETGGARKSALKSPDWIKTARELLANVTNTFLEQAGISARLDHRSYAEQGIDRPPGVHLGPAGAARLRRGARSRRAEDLAQHQTAAQEARQLVQELRQEARAVELDLAALSAAPALTNSNSTTAMLARAQRQATQEQQDAAAKKPERRKSNDFEFRP